MARRGSWVSSGCRTLCEPDLRGCVLAEWVFTALVECFRVRLRSSFCVSLPLLSPPSYPPFLPLNVSSSPLPSSPSFLSPPPPPFPFIPPLLPPSSHILYPLPFTHIPSYPPLPYLLIPSSFPSSPPPLPFPLIIHSPSPLFPPSHTFPSPLFHLLYPFILLHPLLPSFRLIPSPLPSPSPYPSPPLPFPLIYSSPHHPHYSLLQPFLSSLFHLLPTPSFPPFPPPNPFLSSLIPPPTLPFLLIPSSHPFLPPYSLLPTPSFPPYSLLPTPSFPPYSLLPTPSFPPYSLLPSPSPIFLGTCDINLRTPHATFTYSRTFLCSSPGRVVASRDVRAVICDLVTYMYHALARLLNLDSMHYSPFFFLLVCRKKPRFSRF
ncbi:hypothetical protein C7M84_014598 [Penaeus vannamei]|uniref:Uncharacterized protein n=1 Tax=Penaeus vannamei TaxID=6689 RepID=A0A423ST05_PENVA|nr:hypothetical protein C7M84_014598 [Penaeus vannamei]